MTEVVRRKPDQLQTQPTVVLPRWFRAYTGANTSHPQDSYGIYAFSGKAVLNSLLKRDVGLPYLALSQITPEQLLSMKNLVEIVHAENEVGKMPQKGDKPTEKEITDRDFIRLWDLTKFSILYATVPLLSSDRKIVDGITRVYNFEEEPNGLQMLADLSTQPNYQEKLLVVDDLYTAATDALRTKEAISLAHQRKELLRYPRYHIAVNKLRENLVAGMRNAVEGKREEHNLSVEVTSSFIDSIAPPINS